MVKANSREEHSLLTGAAEYQDNFPSMLNFAVFKYYQQQVDATRIGLSVAYSRGRWRHVRFPVHPSSFNFI